MPVRRFPDKTEELVECYFPKVLDSRNAFEGSSSSSQERKKITVTEDPYEQTFDESSGGCLALQGFRTSPSNIAAIDEGSDSLPQSKRLRCSRARKKNVGFLEPSHTSEPEPEPGPNPEEEVDNILDSVIELSDTGSVLDELAQTKSKFTLPEPPLSSEHGSYSDEGPPFDDEVSVNAADASETQSSTSERAFGSRPRTRMPHSRSATPKEVDGNGWSR